MLSILLSLAAVAAARKSVAAAVQAAMLPLQDIQ
jgi:hypothetical protein